MEQRSTAVFRENTSEQYMAAGYCDLIFGRGRGRGAGNENGTGADNGSCIGSSGDVDLTEGCNDK
jgi:hypothetical protein